jgi:hypothetical protein
MHSKYVNNQKKLLSAESTPRILTHLTNLASNFKNRFPELSLQEHERIWNQFSVTEGENISNLSDEKTNKKKTVSGESLVWCLSEDQVWSFVSLFIYIVKYRDLRVTYKTGFWIGWLDLLTPYTQNS